MNGIRSTSTSPATTVLRLTNARPLNAVAGCKADDVILAAMTHPPRIGEPRPIAALMPQVLARYGLSQIGPLAGSKPASGALGAALLNQSPGPGLVSAIDCEAWFTRRTDQECRR